MQRFPVQISVPNNHSKSQPQKSGRFISNTPILSSQNSSHLPAKIWPLIPLISLSRNNQNVSLYTICTRIQTKSKPQTHLSLPPAFSFTQKWINNPSTIKPRRKLCRQSPTSAPPLVTEITTRSPFVGSEHPGRRRAGCPVGTIPTQCLQLWVHRPLPHHTVTHYHLYTANCRLCSCLRAQPRRYIPCGDPSQPLGVPTSPPTGQSTGPPTSPPTGPPTGFPTTPPTGPPTGPPLLHPLDSQRRHPHSMPPLPTM